MPQTVCLNGKFLPKRDAVVPFTNRSFRYGDGLFESMVMFRGDVPFLADHLERLYKGMRLLQLELPFVMTTDYLRQCTRQLAYQNGNISDARIRLQVYRHGGGLYTPLTNEASWLIDCQPMLNRQYVLNEEGLRVGIFREVPKAVNILANMKTNNSLPYILGAIYKKNQGLDECLLINDKGNIVESVSSNVFLFKKGILYTPPLSEGCVEGILRKQVLRAAEQLSLKIEESPIQPTDLAMGESLFLTNAVQGIRWIESVEDHEFSLSVAAELANALHDRMFK